MFVRFRHNACLDLNGLAVDKKAINKIFIIMIMISNDVISNIMSNHIKLTAQMLTALNINDVVIEI